ncbi:MAG TPA: hypothetical protein VHF06_07705, partial [Pseudonocardiaceae bacterium]|nr:hypothetical protein [Pseudonocardiaceae bacterium]
QVTGNAVGLVGTASSVNDAHQSAVTGGDTTTSGARRTLSGNVLAEQGATPVQVDGNAVAAAGRAHTRSNTSGTARSRGTIGTSGADGTGSGNVGAVPLAVPVEVTDQAVSGAGNADAAGQNTDTAQAGDNTRPTWRGPSYVATNGDPSTLSGNAAVPGMANPAELTCNAVGAVGNTDAQCASTNTDTAGGVVDTNGTGSTGSGNLATAPVSEPAEVFDNGVAAVGNADAGGANTENSQALGNGFTLGDRSTLSGNDATTPVAGANDVYANGASAIGNAAGTAADDVRSTAGGYSGTTGTGATGSGNIAQVPVAAPVEGYGEAGSLAGTAQGTVPDEEKVVRAGGNPNAKDDNGTASSNVVSTPTALPAQVFGDAVGGVANTSSVANNTTTARAGGDPTATGRHGTASGNVAQLPTAVPAQVFDDGASIVGNGTATGSNDTTAGSGGTVHANGSDGTVAGNVVTVPDAGPVQAFGVAVASPGNEEADSLNDTHTTAGANTMTNGDHGSLAGNVVTAQVTQVEQTLASGVAGAGNSTANGFNTTTTDSGGDVWTSGEWGALSGDLINVPVTDVTQAPADGVVALSNQRAFADSTTSAVSGGASHTAGGGFADGIPVVAPFGVNATVFRVPVDVLGDAIETGHHTTTISDGDTAPRLDMPVGAFDDAQQFGPSEQVDRLLGANQVPGIADLFTVPGMRGPLGLLDMQHTQVLPVIHDGLPETQVFPAITDGMDLTQQLPAIPRSDRPGPQSMPRTMPQSMPQSMPTTMPTTMPRTMPFQRYQPVAGELPVGGALPGTPGGPPVASANLPTLTNAHVPSLPSAPGLPGTPSPQSAPALPQVPGLPALPELPGVHVPSVPSTQSAPAGLALPDLPPVPTLPAMPALPGKPGLQDAPAAPSLPVTTPHLTTPSVPTLPTPHVSGPDLPTSGLPTSGLPSTQDAPSLFTPNIPVSPRVPTLPTAGVAPQNVPAGPAQQLMAQLRGLISERENAGGGRHVHPMDAVQEPATALMYDLPVLDDDFEPPAG